MLGRIEEKRCAKADKAQVRLQCRGFRAANLTIPKTVDIRLFRLKLRLSHPSSAALTQNLSYPEQAKGIKVYRQGLSVIGCHVSRRFGGMLRERSGDT